MTCPIRTKKYLEFGNAFEERFLSQQVNESRDMLDTLNLSWELLRILPRDELDRLSPELIEKYMPGD